MAGKTKKQKNPLKTPKARGKARKSVSKILSRNTLRKKSVTRPSSAKPAKKKTVSSPSSAKKTAKPVNAKALAVGSMAPRFDMPATLVGSISNDDLKGKIYILYFYPKDDTSGCTAEACGFRDALPNFSSLGITVIGVSKDSLESHEKFSRKYNLTFPLASDNAASVCESYGTWVQKSMYGRSYMGIERSTFLVDGKGVIRALWRKVSVPGHVEDVRKAVEAL